MARTRRKLYHFETMLKDGLTYFDCHAVKSDDGKKGTRYLLCNKLTEAQKEHLQKFDNVVISSCYYRYAPELKHDTLIILK